MIPRRSLLLLTAFAAILTACDDDDDLDGVIVTVPVRIVNASSGTVGTVDVSAAGVSIATGLAFRATTVTCVNLPVATSTLTFTSGGATIATATTSFAAGGKYTIVLTGTGTTRTALFLTDNATTPTTGNASLRFVNATAIAGDVHATPVTTTTLTASTVIAGGGNLALNTSTAYITTPQTNNRFRLTAVNTPGTVRSDTGTTAVVFPVGGISTFIFTEAGTPAGATFIQVSPCL